MSEVPVGHRKLVTFSPDFSMGSLATILSLVGTLLFAYGKYAADEERTKLEIEVIKASIIVDRASVKETTAELKRDVRKIQETVTSVNEKVTTIKAEIDAKKGKP